MYCEDINLTYHAQSVVIGRLHIGVNHGKEYGKQVSLLCIRNNKCSLHKMLQLLRHTLSCTVTTSSTEGGGDDDEAETYC